MRSHIPGTDFRARRIRHGIDIERAARWLYTDPQTVKRWESTRAPATAYDLLRARCGEIVIDPAAKLHVRGRAWSWEGWELSPEGLIIPGYDRVAWATVASLPVICWSNEQLAVMARRAARVFWGMADQTETRAELPRLETILADIERLTVARIVTR